MAAVLAGMLRACIARVERWRAGGRGRGAEWYTAARPGRAQSWP